MARLLASSPELTLPAACGDMRLEAVAAGPITSLMPFAGREAALDDALQAAHGLRLPGPGRTHGAGDARIVWTGRAQAFLIGVPPDAGFGAHAAVTDQTDAWVTLRLTGNAGEVLARLVPVDLSAGAFLTGHAARTLLGHMMALIFRASDAPALTIMVMRSFAGTAVHEIGVAMQSLHARARLD